MTKQNYSLASMDAAREFSAPELPYLPPEPKHYRPRIALIGCGGISSIHLDTYRRAGWDVVALCSRRKEAAEARRNEFYPGAAVYTDYRRMLEREDADVVDIAMYPEPRLAVMEAVLKAGRHVLSQKPFVLNLKEGKRLVALAEKNGCKLAVNQNGRWAPYACYASQAIRAGLIGEVQSVVMNLNWDHSWIKGTPSEEFHHMVLQNFAIHYFDMTSLFFGERRALKVFATTAFVPGQEMKPPAIGSAVVQFDQGTATLSFDAHSRFGPEESLRITGTEGTLRARGPLFEAHDLTIFTRRGFAKPHLKGRWFNDGFRGAMGELLCAIEQNREPSNSARGNLRSLALCYAAVKSADTGRAVTPSKV